MFTQNFLLVFVLVLSETNPSEGRVRVNTSCRGARLGKCTDIWKCPYYATQLRKAPRSAHLMNEMKVNLCGFVNPETPKVCCSRSSQAKNKPTFPDLLPRDICGPVLHSSRIVGGGHASPREFPWMALIAYKTGESPSDEDFKCGGTVIHERFILTAAHCLEDNTVLGVRLGEHNIGTELDCDSTGQKCESPVQDILINKIIIHPRYNPISHANDIALIRLATPANFSYDNVKPVCLPNTNVIEPNNMVGKFVTVTGWGVTETGHKSMILSKVSIPIVPLRECQKLYGKFKVITKNQICAGGYMGRDSCSGDSGGPLQHVVPMGHSHRYVQDGIVSYGLSQCGVEGSPAIYTNVREYMSWILSNIEPE